MSAYDFYTICLENINKSVEITCYDGTVHRGVLTRVDESNVYIQPFDKVGEEGPMDDSGTFAWGWGLGLPVAVTAIAAIVAWPFIW
ncbi:hypothetical protein EV207_11853 [Scopulibacillus darangshiensis]|uniref:LSM domain-containing protein n=1 Tax=Scopulibacillus darangshiensis TaxID=442528 RepID=A0A4R2P0C6_9BACL|nr:hypothetical protein [Scopulibacillus darangshiensis]TCP27075.1 hypothetical protein EV207_11853 [Scopulibacillus darangshiensis]